MSCSALLGLPTATRSCAAWSGTHHQQVTDKEKLPPGSAIVVSTVAKWSLTALDDPYDVLFVDEAWQMAWSDFMVLGQVAGRFVPIGVPGQIPPVVPIPVERWETSPRAPHQPAPRHRSGRVVVSRDPLRATHESHIPLGEQAVGRPDVTGRGHGSHLELREQLGWEWRVRQAA